MVCENHCRTAQAYVSKVGRLVETTCALCVKEASTEKKVRNLFHFRADPAYETRRASQIPGNEPVPHRRQERSNDHASERSYKPLRKHGEMRDLWYCFSFI